MNRQDRLRGIIWLIGFFGLVFVFFNKPVARLFLGTQHATKVSSVGQIAQIQGSVQIVSEHGPRAAKAGDALAADEKVVVGPKSYARVNGQAGWAFELSADSQVFFEERNIKDGAQWVVHIVNGRIQVLQAGDKPLYAFLKDGFWLNPSALLVPPLDLQDDKVTAVSKAKSDTLSTESILNALLAQKNQLQRCFAEKLQREPAAQTNVTLSMLVEPAGFVKNVEVIGPFSDPQFQSCISQVLERLRFAAFGGDPILMNVPLMFQ